jgi:hypothetical protein
MVFRSWCSSPPASHQPPEVNYIEVLANADYPAGSTSEVDLLLDFSILENGPKVHFGWLVEGGHLAHVTRRGAAVRQRAAIARQRAHPSTLNSEP